METREYVYKQGSEGESLMLDVHWYPGSPQGESHNGHPIVVIFHGGGFVLGSKSIIPQVQIKTLCRLGFVVVVPNFRLCPHISVFDGPVTDSRDCLKWIVSSLLEVLDKESSSVKVDVNQIAVMGHSSGAGLALLMANTQIHISAVLDFYGGKYYTDPTWHSPTPFFANSPDYPASLADKVFSGPQVSAATPWLGQGDIPPRDAWLSNGFKSGKHLSLVTKDGDYTRIDGASGFSPVFPPTMFIHGDSDTVTPARISQRAHEELKSLGVKTELVLVPGKDHMFDMFYGSEEDDEYRKYVYRGFEFLANRVGLYGSDEHR